MRQILVLSLAAATFTLQGAGQYTPEQIRTAITKAGGPEKFLSVIAGNTAKMSGQMVDDQTQMNGAVSSERTLVYYMRLVNYDKRDIGNVSAFRKKIASTLAPSVCTAPTASILINEHNAEYKYMAYSKSREYLFEYTFSKASCAPNYNW